MIVEVGLGPTGFRTQVTQERGGEAIPLVGNLLERVDVSLFSVCRLLGVPSPRGRYERYQRLDTPRDYISCMRYLSSKGIQPEAIVRAVAELLAVGLQRELSGYVCHVRVTPVEGMDTALATPGVEPTLIVGDQAYRLVPSYHPNGDTLKHAVEEIRAREAELRTAYEATARAGQEELRRRLSEMQRELTRQHPLPLITLTDAQQGVFVFAEGGNAYVCLPFHYSPKYMTGAGEWRELSNEDKQATERRVVICFSVIEGSRLSQPLLLTPPPSLLDFRHYHIGCWGTWRAPAGVMIPDGLFTIRTQLEVELYTINGNSLADRTPPELPAYADLSSRATHCETPVFEVPEPVPAPARTVPPPRATMPRRARGEVPTQANTQANVGVWNLG